MALPVIGGSRYIEPRCIFCQEVLSKTIVFTLHALVLTKILRYNIICTCITVLRLLRGYISDCGFPVKSFRGDRMTVNGLSGKYAVKKLENSDIQDIFNLCCENRSYYI